MIFISFYHFKAASIDFEALRFAESVPLKLTLSVSLKGGYIIHRPNWKSTMFLIKSEFSCSSLEAKVQS